MSEPSLSALLLYIVYILPILTQFYQNLSHDPNTYKCTLSTHLAGNPVVRIIPSVNQIHLTIIKSQIIVGVIHFPTPGHPRPPLRGLYRLLGLGFSVIRVTTQGSSNPIVTVDTGQMYRCAPFVTVIPTPTHSVILQHFNILLLFSSYAILCQYMNK